MLYAFSELANRTARGSVLATPFLEDLTEAGRLLVHFANFPRSPKIAMGFIALVFLAWVRDAWFGRGLIGAVIIVATFLAAKVAPWEMVGLEAMKGITWSRILSACDPLILAVCARALTYLETRCGDFLARGVPAFAIGVAVSALCWQKGLHLYSYLNFAGQIQFHGIRNLVQKPEADEGLVRTVTMRMWRPEPNLVAGVYGRDSLDGTINLVSRDLTDYWNQGIMKDRRARYDMPEFALEPRFFDPQTRIYALDNQVSLAHLAIGNVRYVVSGLPMAAPGLHEVSVPPAQEQLGVAPASMSEKLLHYGKKLDQAWNGFSVYVYRLDETLPRAFGARGSLVVDDDAPLEFFADMVGRHALQRLTVVRRSNSRPLDGSTAGVTVSSIAKTDNGYEARIDAAEGGVVVFNVPFTPFWYATADGRPCPAVPVNMIHTAVPVPPGITVVSLDYRRPLLRERLLEAARAWLN
jgi:hypothetical protein